MTSFRASKRTTNEPVRLTFYNTAVNAWGDQFWTPACQFSVQNLISNENTRNNHCHAKQTKEIEKFLEICKRKQKRENENLRLFEQIAYWSTNILLIYHSAILFWDLTKKLYALKHWDLLAYMLYCNLCERNLFWHPKARFLFITTFAHARTFDRCVTFTNFSDNGACVGTLFAIYIS